MIKIIKFPVFLFSVILAYGQDQLTIDNFELKNVIDNNNVSLKDFNNNKGVIVIFWSTSCPYSNYYINRVKHLANKYRDQNIRFILINSNFDNTLNAESEENMKEEAKNAGFSLPYLVDSDQNVMKMFGVKRNPHAFFLVPVNSKFRVMYHGAIDDNPQVEEDVGITYLENAIRNYLQGKEIKRGFERPTGCVIRKN